jgi:hypothetical protein
MSPLVESMEGRVLFSQALPIGAQLHWLRMVLPNRVAGQRAPTLSVEVEDANGHRLPTASGTVLFAEPIATNQLFGTATVINGVARLRNVILRVAGIYGITATMPNTVGASTYSFTVSPGHATALKVYPPASYDQPNGSFDFNVEVVDKYGNVVTSNYSVVRIAAVKPKTVHVNLLGHYFFSGQQIQGALIRRGRIYAYGMQIQDGTAGLLLKVSGTLSSSFSVRVIDSNPDIRPVMSPTFSAAEATGG